MLKFVNDAKLRAGSILREWKEKREEQKAQKQATAEHSEHGHGRFFLLTIPATATICAAIVEVYWALLFCIEATGRLDWNFDLASAWNEPLRFVWNFAFNGNAPVLIGLLAATAPIVMISMVWLPVQFAMRGFGRWRRGSLIAVGLLCNAIVIISGTVVMNHNRQEQIRDSLVIEQSADADRAAVAARLSVAQTELARITAEGNTSNEARAARAGVAGWATYVREAQRDPGVPAADRQRIERAMGSAEAADRLRARIEELTVQQAVAAPTATTQMTVQDNVGAEMNAFSEKVKVYRPPLIAVACTFIGILGAWWTLAMLLGLNPRDVLRSGWADEGHRIEDLRAQEPVVPQPMERQREVVTDAETGEELVRVRESKPRDYWRKVKKGKPTRVNVEPDIPPDETGVNYDGGKRTAVTLGGEMELPASAIPEAAHDEVYDADRGGQAEANADEHDEQPNGKADGAGQERGEDTPNVESTLQPDLPSDEEAALALQELELTATVAPEHLDEGNGENAEHPADEEHHETSDREEPETNPARMIAAE